MLNDFNLTKLAPHGKLFIALFAVLIIFVIVWMAAIVLMEAGILGDVGQYEEAVEPYEEYDFEADMETIMADEQAVSPPDWSDSGQQVPIEPEDIEEFEEYAEEEYALSFWEKLKENLEWAIEHLSSQALLFFTVGLVFMFTTYSAGTKKFFIWILMILIVLHVLGITGFDFCLPANILMWVFGPLLLVWLLIMDVMILANLRKRG
jgi:small-conductance mechanosensitive channel